MTRKIPVTPGTPATFCNPLFGGFTGPKKAALRLGLAFELGASKVRKEAYVLSLHRFLSGARDHERFGPELERVELVWHLMAEHREEFELRLPLRPQ